MLIIYLININISNLKMLLVNFEIVQLLNVAFYFIYQS